MNWRECRRAGVLILLALVPAMAAEGATLYAIGSDPNTFVPDQLTLADTGTQSVTPIATLGDGSLGFNGGLAFGLGGLLYAIANDSSGAGSLYQVQGSPGRRPLRTRAQDLAVAA